jgi:hypothetical protein
MMKNGNGSVLVSAKPKLRIVAQVHRMSSGVSTRPMAEYRARTRDPDAAATQIGQLMPGSAEKRMVAPSAAVIVAQIQAVLVERGWSVGDVIVK